MSESEINFGDLAEQTISSALESMSNEELAGLLEENTAVIKKAASGQTVSPDELRTATLYITKIATIFENKL